MDDPIDWSEKKIILWNEKTVILWKERITWALIWKTHTMWSELPPEIYRMIDKYMKKKVSQCLDCKRYVVDPKVSGLSLYCHECVETHLEAMGAFIDNFPYTKIK